MGAEERHLAIAGDVHRDPILSVGDNGKFACWKVSFGKLAVIAH